MREWKKYFITKNKELNKKCFSRRNDVVGFHEELAESPKNVNAFIEKSNNYLSNQIRNVLRRNINKASKTLSLGCGDGEHEIPLINEGYNIILSDFNESRITNTKKLFPHCKILKIDILDRNFTSNYKDFIESFDVVFVPGLFYAYNDDESLVVLNNIKLLTKTDGKVIITHRARNSFFTKLIDGLCKYEVKLIALIHFILKRKNIYTFSRSHGYRRSINKFSELVVSTKMKIINSIYLDYYSELKRLIIISKLKLFYILGMILNKRIAYLNFFIIKKD